jgi:hypothetical protein
MLPNTNGEAEDTCFTHVNLACKPKKNFVMLPSGNSYVCTPSARRLGHTSNVIHWITEMQNIQLPVWLAMHPESVLESS